MNPANPDSDQDNALRPALLLSMAGLAVFMAAAMWLSQSGSLLPITPSAASGKALVEEAGRLKAAGMTESARDCFQRALTARFDAEHDRAFAYKQYGVFLCHLGEYEACLPYLREALQSPAAPISAFEPLVQAFNALDRPGEAATVLESWRAAAREQGAKASEADAHFYMGLAALKLGDRQEARRQFLSGLDAHPGGRCAAELARVSYEDGDPKSALAYVEQFLSNPHNGGVERIEYARALRQRIQDSGLAVGSR